MCVPPSYSFVHRTINCLSYTITHTASPPSILLPSKISLKTKTWVDHLQKVIMVLGLSERTISKWVRPYPAANPQTKPKNEPKPPWSRQKRCSNCTIEASRSTLWKSITFCFLWDNSDFGLCHQLLRPPTDWHWDTQTNLHCPSWTHRPILAYPWP